MKLMRRLTRASLRLNPVRTMVTILGIALSTALITSVLTLFSCGRDAFIHYKKAQDGDWHVALLSCDNEKAEKISAMDEVERISAVKGIGFARIKGIQNDYKPYVCVRAYDEISMKTLGIRLIQGRLPENENEIVIPSHLYTNGRFKDWKVGDQITLELGQRKIADTVYPLCLNEAYDPDIEEELVNDQSMTYTVVGQMERPSYLIENSDAAGYTCITAMEEEVSGDYTAYIRLKNSTLDHVEQVLKKITGEDIDSFGEFGYSYRMNFNLIEIEKSLLSNDSIASLAKAGAVALVIIIISSVICIRNSFAISISEKVRGYGMLCSIGATKRQVRKNVFYEAFLLGVCGIPLGVVFGLIASVIMVHVSNHYIGIMEDELGFLLSFSARPLWIVAGAVLAALTVFLSSLSGVFIASRVSPLDAIRTGGDRRDIRLKSKRIRFKNVCADIASKNRYQSRRKYRTTVLSVTACVSLYVAMSGFVSMFYYTIRNEHDRYQYDLEIQLDAGRPRDYDSLISKMSEFDDIERFTFRKDQQLTIVDPKYTKTFEDLEKEAGGQSTIFVYGVSDEEMDRIADEIGCSKNDAGEGAILVNTEIYSDEEIEMKMKEKFAYSAGDRLTVQYGDHAADTAEVKLAAVTDRRIFSYSATSFAALVVGEECYKKITGSEMPITFIRFFYKSKSPVTLQDEAEDFLNSDEMKALGVDYENLGISVNNVSESRKRMEALITLVSIFLYGFIIVIAFIGVTNIINTVITNTELRRSEYAMLCSVGMSDSQLLQMIGIEHMMVGGAALMTGLPIGVLLSYILGRLLEVNFFLIPWQGIILSSLAVVLLLFWLTRFSYKRFRRQNMIETIRSREL